MIDKFYMIFRHLQSVVLFMIIAGFVFTPNMFAQGEGEDEIPERQMRAKTTTSLNKNTEEDLIETQISAYKAVACSASEINAQISEIAKLKGITLLIYDEELVATLAEYSLLINQIRNLLEAYEKALPMRAGAAQMDPDAPQDSLEETVSGIINPIKNIENSVFDTMARFKTDTEIVGTNASIAKEEFISKALKNLNIDVFYPEKAIPMSYDRSLLLEGLKLLAEKRVNAQVAMAIFENEEEFAAKEIHFKLKTLNEQYDRTLERFGIFSVTDSFENRIPKGTWENLGEDDPQKEFYEGQEPENEWYSFNRKRWRKKRGYPPQRNIIEYFRAEMAYQLINPMNSQSDDEEEGAKPSDVYWFDVNIAAAGSNRRTQTNAVIDIFRGGNKLTYSAGAVVSYRIFSSNGRVIASDTVMTYMPYKKSGEITEYVCRPTNTKNSIP